jgi:hypothetical protein
LKKSTKKLLPVSATAVPGKEVRFRPNNQKFFWLFFFKTQLLASWLPSFDGLPDHRRATKK